MADLFSFLDDVPPEAELAQDVHIDAETSGGKNANAESSRKRKVGSPKTSTPPPNEDIPETVTDSEPGPSSKKPRMASPKPIVVDEVEIEAKREVAASAGLTGVPESGTRLELRHQVCPTL